MIQCEDELTIQSRKEEESRHTPGTPHSQEQSNEVHSENDSEHITHIKMRTCKTSLGIIRQSSLFRPFPV